MGDILSVKKLLNKKALIALPLFFFLFTLLGFFILPPILKSMLVTRISDSLQRKTNISEIKFNPYTLTLKLRGLSIMEKDGKDPFFSCEEILMNLEGLSVLRMAIVLKELKLAKPYINLVRKKDMSYNFSDLLETKKTDTGKKQGSSSIPIKFSLNDIIIENGSIDFVDEPKEAKHTIRDMKIVIPFLSNIPSDKEKYVHPYFYAKINDTPYLIKGKTKPFSNSLETSFDINIKDLDIPDYLSYIPFKTNFIVKSGHLDVDTKLSYIQTRKRVPSLTVEGKISIKDLSILDNKKEHLFSAPLFSIEMLSSEVFSERFHLSRISLESPSLKVERGKEGELNIKTVLPTVGEAKKSEKIEKKKPSPLSIDIDEVILKNGKIDFIDRSTPQHFKTLLNPLDITVKGISNRKDAKSRFRISVKTESNEEVTAEGLFSLNPFTSEGELRLISIPLKKYDPYYSEKFPFPVEQGNLELSTSYRLKEDEKNFQIHLSSLNTLINGIRLKQKGEKESFFSIQEIFIKETDVDLTKKEVVVGKIATKKGSIQTKRLSDGELDLVKSFSGKNKGRDSTETTKKEQEKDAIPWRFFLKDLSLDDYRFVFLDQKTPSPTTVVLQLDKLSGKNITNENGRKGNIQAQCLINKKGKASFGGSLSLMPIKAELKIDMDGVEIMPFQPYFTENIGITVIDGSISTKGDIKLALNKGRPDISLKGDAILSRFSSIDKLDGKDIVNLESLSINDFRIDYAPLSINIKGVSIADLYAFVYINDEGKINLMEAFKKKDSERGKTSDEGNIELKKTPDESKDAAKDNTQPGRIKIEEVSLLRGKMVFLDRYIKPEFSTTISEMTGRVTGLSSETGTAAELDFLARLNNFAPVEIKGKINPLQKDLYADIRVKIKDLDLSPATPYSGKYVGYTIEKGKLSYEAKYSISNRKIDAENYVLIDQFTFGERVESPHATSLPVRLAVALLKDRNGRINLELPVTGSFDDPKFSIGRIILQIIVNIIVKAATSPFALLGAIFGGGEELSYIEFDYGMSSIPEAEMKKLSSIKKAMEERPSLNLEIEGHVDTERDTDGIKRLILNRKVKLQKLNEMVKKNLAKAPVDDVKIEHEEYYRFLKMAYREEKFPKPRNLIGMLKDIPVQEMEKLILTHIQVTDGDLRTLASQRAMKIKEEILKSEKISPERIFIVEPRSLNPEKKEKGKDSRVDLRLK